MAIEDDMIPKLTIQDTVNHDKLTDTLNSIIDYLNYIADFTNIKTKLDELDRVKLLVINQEKNLANKDELIQNINIEKTAQLDKIKRLEQKIISLGGTL